ncbi:hypothetical protein P3X46_026003, partial [Hevea brasiliensis]
PSHETFRPAGLHGTSPVPQLEIYNLERMRVEIGGKPLPDFSSRPPYPVLNLFPNH